MAECGMPTKGGTRTRSDQHSPAANHCPFLPTSSPEKKKSMVKKGGGCKWSRTRCGSGHSSGHSSFDSALAISGLHSPFHLPSAVHARLRLLAREGEAEEKS